jgi:ArsR family transcriptional regulator, lead/cadmium/zinc/bismuth-responsive transcriptional repressor
MNTQTTATPELQPVADDLVTLTETAPAVKALSLAAGMFRALSDPARLEILVLVAEKERTVGELAQIQNNSLPLVSQRLRWLKTERLVVARRQGKNMYYAAADQHVVDIVKQALAHASEPTHS